ncbi:MAG: tyrosine-type recombinase/integrase, partial [Thermoprotei archaeon]
MSQRSVMRDLRGYLTDEEVHRVIEGATNQRDMLFLRFLYVTGCRISEVVGYPLKGSRGVTPSDFNFDEGYVVVDTLKRRQPVKRIITLDSTTLNMVKEYVENAGVKNNQRLFPFTR